MIKNPWFILVAILSLGGLALYQVNIEFGSWIMGIASGIGICIIQPIYKDLLILQLSMIRNEK